MATVEVRDATGGVVGERDLPEALFDVTVNVPVMHQVVVAGAAAIRAGTHSTKTRGDVAGGGRKPWRQKGTGRARQGSIRAPHWAGGGVAHGPHPRDHSMRVNRKMRQAALRSALTDASRSGKLAVVDALGFDEPKTKSAAAVLTALGLEGKVLLVIARPDELVEKSFRNLDRVRIAYPGNLSTFDLLYADRVLFTAEALDVLAAERGVEGAGAVASAEEPAEEPPAGTEPEAPDTADEDAGSEDDADEAEGEER